MGEYGSNKNLTACCEWIFRNKLKIQACYLLPNHRENEGILHSILIDIPFKERKQYFLAFIKVEF